MFEQLKTMFSSEEYLVNADPHQPLVMETDTYDRAVGAVLLQENQNGNLHPCAFNSRKLTHFEQNCIIWEKELLAI